jgi:hypothetical protein
MSDSQVEQKTTFIFKVNEKAKKSAELYRYFSNNSKEDDNSDDV